jgi:gamma-glutamylcyclotransferase (GGCT)/AIG2-like uncharacterized protein YtfP
MSWLSTLTSAGQLDEAVSHVDEALDLLERAGTEADAARCLSEALTALRAAWSLTSTRGGSDEAATFPAMLAQALCPESQAELLGSDQVARLPGLEPGGTDRASRTRLLERVAALVLVKAEPGEAPATLVVPVQSLLVNLLLDRPDERLVIYGTLAPGQPNHNVIEDLRGVYRDCSVHGRISEVDELPYFTWAPSAAGLRAVLFSSRQLPDKWVDLDLFEGDGYKRRLIPATVGDQVTVASIYLSTADDRRSSPGR